MSLTRTIPRIKWYLIRWVRVKDRKWFLRKLRIFQALVCMVHLEKWVTMPHNILWEKEAKADKS